MTWYYVVGIIFLAYFILAWMIPIVLALCMPKILGRQLLKKRLKKYGIDVRNIPCQFFSECVDESYDVAKFFSGGDKFIISYTKHIEYLANTIAHIVGGSVKENNDNSYLFEMVRKYNIFQSGFSRQR